MKIANFYNIPIGNAKKMVSNFFDKEKYVPSYKNLQLYLRLGLKLKNTSCIRIQSIAMTNTICWINTHQGIESKKLETKMEKHCANWWAMLQQIKQHKT